MKSYFHIQDPSMVHRRRSLITICYFASRASMKTKNVCHLPFFAQVTHRSLLSSSLERISDSVPDNGQHCGGPWRRTGPVVCELLRSRFAFGWLCYRMRILLYRACILKDTYVSCCILEYLKCILKALVFFGRRY